MIHGNVHARGNIGTLQAIGGDILGSVSALPEGSFGSSIGDVRSIASYNAAAGTVLGGSIQGDIMAGEGISEVLTTSDLMADIDAGAYLDNLIVLGDMAPANVSAERLGNVYVQGAMTDSTVRATSGGLSSLYVENGIRRSTVSISGGNSGFVGTGGDLEDSLIQSDSNLDAVYVGRDYIHSSIEVRSLGSVHINNRIVADQGDRIHAEQGGFWASWSQGGRGVWLSEEGDDEDNFGDLTLSVG
jgi:hypothetical protein